MTSSCRPRPLPILRNGSGTTLAVRRYIDNIDTSNVDPFKLASSDTPGPDGGDAWGDPTRTPITAGEAAARLGVKRETVYAYVSRGRLHARRALDGKTSLFDPAEVDALRARRGRRRGRLEVPVVTGITDVGDGRIRHRGVELTRVVAENWGYETLAAWLWSGRVDPATAWTAPESLVAAVAAAMTALGPGATGGDRLAAGVAAAAAADPVRDDRSPAGAVATTRNLLAALVEALPLVDGAATPDPDTPLARRLWPRLTAVDPVHWPLLDRALVVLADHGMATSTLAARLAASTRAAPPHVVLAALGTLAGPLHGGASRAVHRLFEHAHRDDPRRALAQAVHEQGRIPGVGHPVHRRRDPRYELLLARLREDPPDPDRLTTVETVVATIDARADEAPNVDLALGALTFVAGMDPAAGEVVFALARIAGWTAHALEEYRERPLRFRATGRYVDRPLDPAAGVLP